MTGIYGTEDVSKERSENVASLVGEKEREREKGNYHLRRWIMGKTATYTIKPHI